MPHGAPLHVAGDVAVCLGDVARDVGGAVVTSPVVSPRPLAMSLAMCSALPAGVDNCRWRLHSAAGDVVGDAVGVPVTSLATSPNVAVNRQVATSLGDSRYLLEQNEFKAHYDIRISGTHFSNVARKSHS